MWSLLTLTVDIQGQAESTAVPMLNNSGLEGKEHGQSNGLTAQVQPSQINIDPP